MFSTNLCLIATGRYMEFVPNLLRAAWRWFLPDFDVTYHIFTDTIHSELQSQRPIRWHAWPHKPWPHGTLMRYHAMRSAEEELLKADWTYYIDADMDIVAHVGDEIFSDLVAVRHHGYMSTHPYHLPYERRGESQACVPLQWSKCYYAGAFQGGRTEHWMQAMRAMQQGIDADIKNGITAINNDESFWNQYLATRTPTLILPPQYCWHPPHPGRPYSIFDPEKPPKIVALDKNHDAVRAI